MSSFAIRISLNSDFFSESFYKEIIYREVKEKRYYDKVYFETNCVYIFGNRTSEISNEHAIETQASTYFKDIVKSLLYVYFKYGSFEINNIIMYVDGKQLVNYESIAIFQNFNCNTEYKSTIDVEKIFNMKLTDSNVIMNCLMQIVLSLCFNTEKFSYSWKCFNALLNHVTTGKTEQDKLRQLRVDIEEHVEKYPNSIQFVKNNDMNVFLDKNYFKGALLSAAPEDGKDELKKFIDYYKNFSDYRVAEVLKKYVNLKKSLLESKNKYQEIINYLDKCIDQSIEKDTDVVRMLILKCAYYLRNKYFHAEKIPTSFILKNDNDEELDIITVPLRWMCIDIINYLE